MKQVMRLTDRNFEAEVLNSDVPILVEFWASWCPPCKMMDTTLERLSIEYNGRLKVGKINADQNTRMRVRYAVQGLPTFIIFAAGEIRGRSTGAKSKRQLETLLEESGVFTSQPEVADQQDQDEEEIKKRLRALGYVE